MNFTSGSFSSKILTSVYIINDDIARADQMVSLVQWAQKLALCLNTDNNSEIFTPHDVIATCCVVFLGED